MFSRRIVGWQLSTSLSPDLALDAPNMGLWTRQHDGHDIGALVHHSDRGVRYVVIRRTEAEAGVVASGPGLPPAAGRTRAAAGTVLRIAIDDAGAGFASLHHIVELEPDIIKIDRSLVDGISSSKALRSIVTGFVLLALDSDATLVAEGVETANDLHVLAALGVDAAQGYLLARPSTDPADLDRWLRTTDMRAGLL